MFSHQCEVVDINYHFICQYVAFTDASSNIHVVTVALSGQTIFSAAFYLRIPYRLDLFVAKLFHNKHIKLDVCLNFLLSYPLLRFVCSTKSDNCFLPYSITMITTRAFHMSSGWVWTHCRTSWVKMSAAHFTTSFMLSCEMGSHRDNNGIFNTNNRV